MTEKRIAAKLAASAPPMPRESPIGLLNVLGQASSGRMGKLNIRRFNESHHGRISPFAPHLEPQSLFTPNQKKASNSERNTLETDKPASCRKSRQSIYSIDAV